SDPIAACSGRTGQSALSPARTRGSSTPAASSCPPRRASGSLVRTPPSSTGFQSRRAWNGGPDVQSYGLALYLRDDPALIARYKKEHAKAWPEVLARPREIGVTEMKIYLLRRRRLMYRQPQDGFDPAPH